VTATGLASRLGFSWDEIEDLRLAVDELCHAVIGPSGRDGVIRLHYVLEGGGLCVEGRGFFDPGGPPVGISELGHQILSALVDEHDVREEEGQPVVWFRKFSAAAGAGKASHG
jgi:anti-sigma regulatory factor (Ser/Thr protein kinase)